MKRLLLFLGVFVFFVHTAFAAIPVPPANYTGSRTTPGVSGMDATGGYTEANGGVQIA